MCGGGPSIPPPAPIPAPPPPQFTADDGTIFTDANAFNSYQKNLQEERFNTDLTAATNRAQSSFENAAIARGLDPSQFQTLADTEIANIRAGIPDLASDVDQFFGPNLGNTILDQEQGRLRTQYSNDVSRLFPTSFAEQTFGSTADDPYIETLFSEHYDPAQQALARARSRGTLTGSGFDYAQTLLDQQADAGRAQLQSLGGDVLAGYRGQLGGIADEARDAARNFELGQDFNLDSFGQRSTDLSNQLSGSLGGDLRTSLGDTQLFDIDKILTQAGSFQGPSNAQGGLLDAISQRRKEEEEQRGLGNQGTF